MERPIDQVVGQVMVYDFSKKEWQTAGTSSGLSTVTLIEYPNNTFRIHGRKINEKKEVVLDSPITREVKYNRANDAFIQWHDSQALWGLNFRSGSKEAENFFASVVSVLKKLHQTNPTITQQQPQQMMPLDAANQQQAVQNSTAATIQRSIQQQQQYIQHQQIPQQQQPLMQQQQAQLLNQQQAQAAAIMSQVPSTQLIQQQQMQQQQQQQQNQLLQQQQQNQLLQQQQLHQHFMQQPQTQSHQPNHAQVNHYQHSQQPPQQMPNQVAPVTTAPIPPPPPPPPPAPPAPPIAMNNCRINGTANAVHSTIGNPQHSPITNYSTDGRNGGSPNQSTSLVSQLKKVNLSRSDSEKESECNNNIIGNLKTTRSASLAGGPDMAGNLMSEMAKKIASRRERLEEQGDSQSVSNNSAGATNGTCGDKSQEGWIADLIRKEISKEITKMKAEIIDVIRTELRQR